MKRFIKILTLFLMVAVLNACSSKVSLKLADKEVDIISDKEKTGSMILQQGENAGKEVVTTSLYYTFSIKNKGSKTIGGSTEYLTVKIEPNEILSEVSKEVMGFNIFYPSEYHDSGLGQGHSFDSSIEPNSEGQYILYYGLGVNEDTSEALHVPSKDQLVNLKKHALDATLIVLLGIEEIARFDLNKKE